MLWRNPASLHQTNLKPVVPFCLQRCSLKVEKKRCVLVQVILGASEHQLWPDTRDASEPLIQVLHDLCRKLLRALVSGTAMEDMWLKEILGKGIGDANHDV